MTEAQNLARLYKQVQVGQLMEQDWDSIRNHIAMLFACSLGYESLKRSLLSYVGASRQKSLKNALSRFEELIRACDEMKRKDPRVNHYTHRSVAYERLFRDVVALVGDLEAETMR